MSYAYTWKGGREGGYSLSVVKCEVFDQLHVMHQAVRNCHTDHNACLDCCTLTMGYGLGMLKFEAFDPLYFMHQAVRVCHIVSSMACIFDFKINFLCNRKLIRDRVGYSLGMVTIDHTSQKYGISPDMLY